jgi:TPP-dependent pyruvate/acetoin dehydrogenase alpha subunit
MPKNQKQVENTEEKTFSLISNEKLLAIYAAMLRCRLLEQRATALFQHGKLDSDLHVSSGLEATAVAAAIDLEQADTLCLAPNDWLPAFVKGMSLDALFRALAPSSVKSTGSTQIEAEHKNILFDSGKADAQKTILDRASEASETKNEAVAAAFIPSGASPLAQWQKTIQTAGTKRLPVVFVHYSDPADAPSSASPLKPEALLHGVPSITVDARDPVAVYRVAYEAIVRARQLRGATLLECMIDSQPPSLGGARSHDLQSAASDPVAAMESYLKSKNIEMDFDTQELISAFNRDLDLATRFIDK